MENFYLYIYGFIFLYLHVIVHIRFILIVAAMFVKDNFIHEQITNRNELLFDINNYK